jgi:large subunit ribosomal protein L15|tara:strand:+ start:2028 stop:2483 length:456 start_codon:yes stop_codon:yes gene_type:complete
MELSNLSPINGSVNTKKKRIGRGQGSGKGGTSTRGHKGAKSRSGYSKKIGFEGGQMPLQRRIPKFGFKNINRVEYQAVNLKVLQSLFDNKKIKKSNVNISDLIKNGLVSKNDLVKILGSGELKTALNIEAHKFSKSAQDKIEKSGGKIKII